MNAGKLDRRITVERKIVTQDATYGTEVITWGALTNPASRISAQVQDVPPSRSESIKQGLAVALNQTKITIRYRADIDSSMRVTVHYSTDVVYQIVGGPARVGERNQFLEMVCERSTS